jgi:hypothetical protein
VAALPAPLPAPGKLSARDLDRLWDGLSDGDPVKAYEALRTLAAAPSQAIPELRQRLRPAAKVDAAAVKRQIAGLDSAEFDEREKAHAGLTAVGEAALPALREATKSPSAEVRRRAEALVERIEGAERLRLRRAVEVLERARTPEAGRLLDELAGGEPGATLTREAGAARKRLGRGPAAVDQP